MYYNFDEVIERRNTGCVKYDLLGPVFGKEDILPFWVADMDFRSPSCVVDAIKIRADHAIYGYPVKAKEFYQSIISWLNRRHGWKIDRNWIVFTPGVVPAINIAIQAYTQPGEGIIIQPPVYFPFFSAVKNNNRNLILNPLRLEGGKYVFDLEDLEKKASEGAKMLILSHPHNPVGRSWTRDELQALSAICNKNNILILSDEIHSDLILGGKSHCPMASINELTLSNTITFMAPSKTFNLAGLAISFLVISNPILRKKYEDVLEQVHVGMGNIFGITALQAAYEHGEEWLVNLLEYLDQNLDLLLTFLEEHLPTIKAVVPEATYLVWLDFRASGIEKGKLKEFLVHEAGIALNDGESFGSGGQGFMRMNIACPKETLLRGLNSLAGAVKRMKVG